MGLIQKFWSGIKGIKEFLCTPNVLHSIHFGPFGSTSVHFSPFWFIRSNSICFRPFGSTSISLFPYMLVHSVYLSPFSPFWFIQSTSVGFSQFQSTLSKRKVICMWTDKRQTCIKMKRKFFGLALSFLPWFQSYVDTNCFFHDSNLMLYKLLLIKV